jgi:hypothetical protein
MIRFGSIKSVDLDPGKPKWPQKEKEKYGIFFVLKS